MIHVCVHVCVYVFMYVFMYVCVCLCYVCMCFHRDNRQVVSGNKTDLINRVLQCIERGCLPNCPQCGIGRLKQRGSSESYYCPGGMGNVGLMHKRDIIHIYIMYMYARVCFVNDIYMCVCV